MWKHTNGSIAARAADDRMHARIEPHPHQTLGATFVFAARKAAQFLDFGIEDDGEARALQRLHAAHEPALLGRVRRRDDTDGVTFDERPWTEQRHRTRRDGPLYRLHRLRR